MFKQNVFLLFFLLLIQICFSQEKYHFDRCVISEIENNYNGFKGKYIEIYSSKDSTYYMNISGDQKSYKNIANLYDTKKNIFYMFKGFSKIESTKDFKKLRYPMRCENIEMPDIKTSENFEEAIFENDSINNSKIVQVITYESKLKKVVQKQTYYFFTLDKNKNFKESLKTKDNLNRKFNIVFKSDENLTKIVVSKEDKVVINTQFLQFTQDEFDLKFNVDEKTSKTNSFIKYVK